MAHTREDVGFTSGRDRCAAWLYRPDENDSTDAGPTRPIVVLGHGLGAVKEMRLDEFAERFVDAGYAALVFDYRHFGASEGTPRHLLDVKRQRADWNAAIAYARSLPAIDADRVAIFGSSFGGGHVLAVAAQDHRVAAVIAQCPFTDGIASSKTQGLGSSLRLGVLAVRDLLAAVSHRSRVLVPLAGHPGETALMNAPDVFDGYLGIVGDGMDFSNAVTASFGLSLPFERPGRYVRDITAPVLFGVCDNDTVAPSSTTLKYAAQARRGTVKRYPIGHFDIYVGEPFEQAIADYVDFLDEHLAL